MKFVKLVKAEQQEDTLIEQVKSEISYLEENLDNAINNCNEGTAAPAFYPN